MATPLEVRQMAFFESFLYVLGAVVQALRPMSRREREEEEDENGEENGGSFVFNY